MAVVSAKNLTKIYSQKKNKDGTHALNGIDLEIEQGEFLGVMGPSGSGKTTLLNLLSGIDDATSGEIEISGKDIGEMSHNEMALFRRRHMGFVFQDFNLLDSLTVGENIMLPMALDDEEPEEIQKRMDEILPLFEIESIKDSYPYTISGGQQQRAAIARAVINRPDIVFADEPTGNLDSKSSATVMQYLEQLNSNMSGTILMVTHDPFAASHCGRVVFIKDGLVEREIHRKDGRSKFFHQIMDVLSEIGGGENVI